MIWSTSGIAYQLSEADARALLLGQGDNSGSVLSRPRGTVRPVADAPSIGPTTSDPLHLDRCPECGEAIGAKGSLSLVLGMGRS